MDERKVVIVGTGQVGASFAFALMMRGTATHILLSDKQRDLAEGHRLDLNHGQLFVPPVVIDNADSGDCHHCDIAVITAGANQKPGQSRMDLVHKNTEIFKSLIPEVVDRFQPRIMLIVTNPVDVLTYVALQVSGYATDRVIGSGTLLDSARFRALLSSRCRVDPRNIHAYIIGEHGDSEVPVWSQANIAGMPMEKFCAECQQHFTDEEKENIANRVKQAAYEIIQKKGATYYAVALALVRIVEGIFRDENSVFTVSSLIEDYYGISDVCFSLPTIVDHTGVAKRISLELDENELKALQHSAETLKKTIDELVI